MCVGNPQGRPFVLHCPPGLVASCTQACHFADVPTGDNDGGDGGGGTGKEAEAEGAGAQRVAAKGEGKKEEKQQQKKKQKGWGKKGGGDGDGDGDERSSDAGSSLKARVEAHRQRVALERQRVANIEEAVAAFHSAAPKQLYARDLSPAMRELITACGCDPRVPPYRISTGYSDVGYICRRLPLPPRRSLPYKSQCGPVCTDKDGHGIVHLCPPGFTSSCGGCVKPKTRGWGGGSNQVKKEL